MNSGADPLPPNSSVIALAAGWGLATVQIYLPALGGNAGFATAAMALGTAAILWLGIRGRHARNIVRPNARVLWAATAIVLAEGIATVLSASPRESAVPLARTAVVAAFGTTCWLAGRHPAARRAFGVAGTIVILANAATLIAAMAGFEALRKMAFVVGAHQYLGAVPRFVGLATHPVTQGMQLVIASALVARARKETGTWLGARQAGLLPWLGLALAATTLSLATLCLPFVGAFLALRGGGRARSWCRRAALAGAVVVPALTLHFHLLEVSLGDHTFEIGGLHSNYFQDGLGAQYMPLHLARVGPLGMRGHWTAYAHVALDAVECFAKHPVSGVGPGQFGRVCPRRMTMGSYGEWGAGGSGFGQLDVLLSERGVLGITALVFALSMVLGSGGLRLSSLAASKWQVAAALVVLVCSLEAAELDTIAAAGFLGLIGAELSTRISG